MRGARSQREHPSQYQYLERALRAYIDDLELQYLGEVTLVTLRDLRSSWKLGPRTALKTLERLKSFFRFCVENEWITKNPAQALKPAEIKPKAIEPYTDEQFQKILAACDGNPRHRTLMLVLRYTGLWISAAVCLRRDAVREDKISIYTLKTVVGVIPPELVVALKVCSNSSTQYFFWSGESKRQTAVNYQQSGHWF